MRTSTISAAAIGRAAACTSAMPLRSICQVRDSTRMDSDAASARPRVRSASPAIRRLPPRNDLYARDEVGELGEVGQHHRRISADVVLLTQFLERGRDIALHQRLEQIDDAGPVGQAQHVAHVLGRTGPAAWAMRLIEQ